MIIFMAKMFDDDDDDDECLMMIIIKMTMHQLYYIQCMLHSDVGIEKG